MTEQPKKPVVTIPQLCERCRHRLIVHDLRISPAGPWMASEVTAQILLFQAAAGDPRIVKRAENETENLTLVLAELGCLACWDPKIYRRVVGVLKKGLDHAAQVSQAKREDPEFGFVWQKPETKEAPDKPAPPKDSFFD